MSSNSSSQLQLRVWQSCRWRREYLDTNKNGLADITSFQECIYLWEPFSDPFGSVIGTELTQQLREVLIENFALARPPHERGIENLKKAIEVMDTILSSKNDSSWGDSEEFGYLSNGGNVNLRQHHLLALRQHIQWIYDTFVGVPGVNVSLR
ncbi:hypothetical protein F7734_34040 [Scytonema sp. UIC 10036]|uniref:hypothetical protein n=1 Tax=Scytonema sp. UIC 10036 TaxID=2304196 RepID=UPI0012DA8599|nr:hypothetical protein [Scytonema sp. UIC 10036]MUG97090.1 hypothetical protein [Scytonema sp. UIC 10036]